MRHGRPYGLPVLALALALTLAQTPQHRLFVQPNLPRSSLAQFEAAPVSGAGIPATAGCYAATAVTGAKGEPATFARASTAWVPSADGQTYTACTSGQLRITSGSIDSTSLGPLVEPVSRNQVYYPSDLTQAAKWTLTNVTAAKTVTGPTGATNSASRITATGANGTAVQASIAAGTAVGSVFLRRTTGTGAVTLTMDNFATGTDVGPSLSTTRWRRAVPRDASGCAGGDCIIVPGFIAYNAVSFTMGIKLAVSGDAVDVWVFQNENITGSNVATVMLTATSPIDVNDGTRGDRVADNLFFTAPAFRPASVSAWVQAAGYQNIGTNVWLDLTDGTDYLRMNASNGATIDPRMQCTRTVSATPATSGGVTPTPMSALTFLHAGCEFTPSGVITTYNRRNAETTTATSAVDNPLVTKVQVGGRFSSTGIEPGGVYKRICADPTAGRCAYTSTGTGGSPIAWVGDSIMYGNAGSSGTGTRPPRVEEDLLAVAGGRTARANYNYAVGGYRTDQCLTVWRDNVRGRGFSTLVLGCGVNSAIQGNPATSALAWADLQAILDEAKADGMTVIPLTILPFGSNANWSAPRQTFITDINSSMTAWCTANGVTCVDAYTSFLGISPAMDVAYDSGDGLHPNAAGSTLIGTLVQAATP